MITKTKRFAKGRFNYSIVYKQFQMDTIDEDSGERAVKLMHSEHVKFFRLSYPFFGESIQFDYCSDTADYYRQ